MGQESARMFHHRLSSGKWPQPNQRQTAACGGPSNNRGGVPADPLVQRAVQWISVHLDSQQLLADLSHHLQVSVNTICRRFQADIGTSPKRLLEQLRMEHACELLRSTDLPMKTVSRLCGFTQSHCLWRGISSQL